MNHKEIRSSRIFSILDKIENKTQTMAHNIDEIKNQLKLWQDGQVSGIFMLETLNQYYDGLSNS